MNSKKKILSRRVRAAVYFDRWEREELEREAKESDMTVEDYRYQLELRDTVEQNYREAKGWR